MMDEFKKNKIGLVGAGYWGKNLIRVFNQFGVLKTICDLNKEVLEEREMEYPNLAFTADFLEILEDKEIKAVVIAAPANCHYDLVKKSLEAGKDVFVEKPLALNAREGEELVELSRNKNLILMVGHLLLYHPAIVKLKEIINRGELGEIRYIWSNRLNLGKLRREENVLWSFAPHDISLIIDILGMPEKISAVGKSYLHKDIPDTTLSILEFKGNKSAHIFVSWLNPFKEQKLSITGSEKMIVFDGIMNELTIYPHKIRNHKEKSPEAIMAPKEIIEVPIKEALLEEAKHFLECIRDRKNPRTDGREALNVLKVLEECQKMIKN